MSDPNPNPNPEYYKDHRGEWRWHVRDEHNRKITAAASEGFASKQKAQENFSITQGYEDEDVWLTEGGQE